MHNHLHKNMSRVANALKAHKEESSGEITWGFPKASKKVSVIRRAE